MILGFGREGKSTLEYILKNNIKYTKLGIADINEIDVKDLDKTIAIYTGREYLEAMKEYELVFQSPGVCLKNVEIDKLNCTIVSQTSYILKYYGDKIIGITGTKGKSTTSTLIYTMLKQKYQVELVGNIGIPAFTVIDKLEDAKYIVYELSSHQLEFVDHSPYIAVILNIFEEHLDHYKNFQAYIDAKKNIARYQRNSDWYIYNETQSTMLTDKLTLKQKLVGVSLEDISNKLLQETSGVQLDLTNIYGTHNMYNLYVAVKIAKILNVDIEQLQCALKEFKPLPHRLELIAKVNDVSYYDDSISTIPEATIQAIEALPNVSTVLIGGMDRGINYSKLEEYIKAHRNIQYILMYKSGRKIYHTLNDLSNVYLVDNLQEAVNMAKKITLSGKSVVLSPAAASYEYFTNFEARGDKYKEYVLG